MSTTQARSLPEPQAKEEVKKVVITYHQDGSANVYNEVWCDGKLISSVRIKRFESVPKRLKFFLEKFMLQKGGKHGQK
jgi:hypothetical protein